MFVILLATWNEEDSITGFVAGSHTLRATEQLCSCPHRQLHDDECGADSDYDCDSFPHECTPLKVSRE